MKNQTARINTRIKARIKARIQFPALRRLCVAALMCCAAAGPARSANDDAAFNFVDTDMELVIKAIGRYTRTTFIIDPRVKGKLTLVSEKPVTRAQAFALLTSQLRLQQVAVVTADGYSKIVPEGEAKLQPSPTQVGLGPSTVKGDQVATQVYTLAHESAVNVMAVLRPLISPNNTINVNPGNNTLVITDYADNLRRASIIIAALDVPGSADVEVIKVDYAVASELATLVNKLLEPGGGGDSGRVSVLADPRTNSVILRAPSRARAALARNLISKLDQPTAQLGNVHVVHLKNADATKLALQLRSVVTSDGTAPASTVSQPTQSRPQGSTGSGGGSLSTPQQLSSGGAAGFIQADPSTNTLIITANESVYRNLRAVIDQLDVRRAMVYIESLIVEVNAAKAAEFGIQWLGLTGTENSKYRIGGGQTFGTGANNIANLIAGNAGSAVLAPGTGLSLALFKQVGNLIGLGAVARALEVDGNANVRSTPTMQTLDNEMVSFEVGQDVPILTGQFTSAAGANTNPFQTIDRKSVGLKLKVRPQISEGGTIKLEIYHESSSVDPATKNDLAGITVNKRVIESNVLADDGQIVVLGGLIEDSTGDGVEKVNGLADLPVVGGMFKYQKRERKKTNLMVFLRPVIIRDKEQSGALAVDRYDLMRAAQAGAEPTKAGLLLPDLGAPSLPKLINGQPSEGTMLAPKPASAPAPTPAKQPAAQPAAQADKQ